MQVILLDTRFFRSPLKPTDQRGAPGKERYLPDDDPAKTMLGERSGPGSPSGCASPPSCASIVSSIQVLAEATAGSAGATFRASGSACSTYRRDRRQRRRVRLGDRHIGGSTASPKACPTRSRRSPRAGSTRTSGNREAGPNRLGAVYGAANFGTIDVDWWERPSRSRSAARTARPCAAPRSRSASWPPAADREGTRGGPSGVIIECEGERDAESLMRMGGAALSLVLLGALTPVLAQKKQPWVDPPAEIPAASRDTEAVEPDPDEPMPAAVTGSAPSTPSRQDAATAKRRKRKRRRRAARPRSPARPSPPGSARRSAPPARWPPPPRVASPGPRERPNGPGGWSDDAQDDRVRGRPPGHDPHPPDAATIERFTSD